MKPLDTAMVVAGRLPEPGALASKVTFALPEKPVSVTAFAPGELAASAANRNAGAGRAAAAERTGGYAAAGKRCLDVFLVILSLPAVLPVVLLCAAALWMEGGNPFYRQARLGRGGKPFQILKLRTMVRDADKKLAEVLEADPEMKREWDETQKLKRDPRITRVGGFLRVSSLDELPQLWNVVKGDMSLVGPRPMMPDQLPLYGNASAYFSLRPGLTGIWQVSERNESRFSDRAQADAEYLEKQSLAFDAQLILRTFAVVFRGTGY